MIDPTEEDLRKYYFENHRKFETQPLVTFTHVFFSVEKRGYVPSRDITVYLNQTDRLGDFSLDCNT